jgi:hypothetical protein
MGGSLTLKTEDNKTVSSDSVRIQVILPESLGVNAWARCEDEFKKTSRGSVYLEGQKRYYGINYLLTKADKAESITIVDLARPVISMKDYYEQIAKIETNPDMTREPEQWQRWQKIQRAEIEAFRETLQRLQGRGHGGLANKLDFVVRG